MPKTILTQKTPKIWVLSSKTAYMQRIADYVRTGHNWTIQGVTEPEKIFRLWDKLTAVHPVFDDKMRAYRARKAGQPTGRLMFYQALNKEQIHWVLLIHAKSEQLEKTEKWRDATGRDRVLMTGYELVRITKEGTEKPVWSWRYQPERYAELREMIVYSIRANKTDDLKRLITTLWGTVGFAGSREQAKALQKLLVDEWKRRNGDKPPPDMPKGFGFVRRKKDAGGWLQRHRKAVNAALQVKVLEKAVSDAEKIFIDSFPGFSDIEFLELNQRVANEFKKKSESLGALPPDPH